MLRRLKDVLDSVTNTTKLFVVIVVVVECLGLAYARSLPDPHKIIALGICASVLVIAIAAVVLIEKRSQALTSIREARKDILDAIESSTRTLASVERWPGDLRDAIAPVEARLREIASIVEAHREVAAAIAAFEGRIQRIEDRAFRCEIMDRASLYLRCGDLIRQADEVLDTTWGPDPPPSPDDIKKARGSYIEARRDAVRRKGRQAEYKELFTRPTSAEGEDRLKESYEESNKHPNYRIKLHPDVREAYSLLDFIVFDGKVVALSHVDADAPRGPQFLIIHCTPLAELFRSWFYECWNRARPVQLTAD